MSVINQNLLLTPEGYQISRSVRLRSSASGYFSRTPSSTTSRTIWTWSAWVKRGSLPSSRQGLFIAQTSGSVYWGLEFDANNCLNVYDSNAAGALTTSSVYRDPSSWYHIVVALDTTQATAANRTKLYVNGSQVTTFGTTNYPTQNSTSQVNTASVLHSIGNWNPSVSNLPFDGYLTEINFIDGQALTPSSFGETDAVTGVWKPKKYAGTYGTNGFYLNFSDNSAATAAAIGKDSSGNGNNWTPNNISVTAGVTYDSMIDVPTMWADGGNGRGNYCVLSPINKDANATVSSGNIRQTAADAAWRRAYSTIAFADTDSFYAEATMTALNSGSNGVRVGVARVGNLTGYIGIDADSWSYDNQGRKYNNASSTTYGASFAQGDVIGIAFGAGTLTFYKNGVSQGSAYTGITGALCFASSLYSSDVVDWNFGQRPFAYTPPTGFKALNTQNLPDATIKKGNAYFDVSTYTGTGSALSVTNSGAMQPDLVWLKSRSNATSNALIDAVRGPTKVLYSQATDAETTWSDALTSFDASGFTIAANSTFNTINVSPRTYVGWQWKESASAGFDIVTYSGTGAAQTVAHSLGVAPRMIIAKRRNGAQNWFVGHGSFASWSSAIEGLNTTAAVNNGATAVWNATAPTSSVFSVGTDLSASGGTYVAYLFAEVAGFSKFGSYTGNGSADGPFVYCGFRPRWVMIKPTVGTGSWQILDTARDTYNVEGNLLWANESTAETSSPPRIDVLSNGFKARAGAGSAPNVSGEVYIYAAFAENPAKYALAR